MAGAITRPGAVKTTAQRAAEHAAANAKAAKETDPKAATQTERASNPGKVRSKNYELRDPSTGIFFKPGEDTSVPYFSGWLISQLEAGIIELVEGDPEIDRASRAEAHKSVLKAEALANGGGGDEINPGNEDTGVDAEGNPVQRKDESDEDFAKRVEEHKNK
jgi:hypothetical protein